SPAPRPRAPRAETLKRLELSDRPRGASSRDGRPTTGPAKGSGDAPGNSSGARTPPGPGAAITVTDSHDAGADASTRSPRGPPLSGRHRRRGPGLVHENQPQWLDQLDLPAERTALPPDLGPVAPGGARGLLLQGDVELPQGPPDDHDAV